MFQDAVLLLFAHYLGDYPLQSKWMAENKSKNLYVLFVHAFIWSALISLLLMYRGAFDASKLIFLCTGHMLMDFIKCRMQSMESRGQMNWWTVIDQSFHFVQIAIVYL